ncbi:MAG: NAD-dependent epimerase/dehydratase family protein [Deltaproteobacteria bacterium]|nr:NAD-dependent epimerase/dehydratase family protein [Deltaproteobacteria bacterium]
MDEGTTVEAGPRRRRRRRRVVALTGVHGAAGAALVRRFEADERVGRLVLLDRRAPAMPLRDTSFRGIDLTATLADVALAEILAREHVHTVVHAAFHDTPRRDVEAAHELEVLGTRAVFRAIADNARRAGTVENVVVLGTTASYGARGDNPQYLDDDAPLRGGGAYPWVADKVAVEQEVASLRTRTGLPIAMLRAAPMLGDDRTLTARLLAAAFVPAVLGADPLVQLLHVEDLVEATRLAVHGRYDGAFNVAADGVLPWSTVIKLSGRVRAAFVEPILRPLLRSLWVVGAGLVPGEHVAYLRETFVADTTRAAEQLGFRGRDGIRGVLARHTGLGWLRRAA